MANDKLKRCFVALELPREAINHIKDIQNLIKKQNLFYGKFTEPENLHLTLKFLGEISDEKIGEIQKRLKEIKFKEFEAELGEVGLFSERYLRIVWIKLGGEEVFSLQKEIDEILGDLFGKEIRFMSHITIARIKSVDDRKQLLNYIKNMKPKRLKFKVRDFIFKKSELKPEGPIYSDIEKYNLEKEGI